MTRPLLLALALLASPAAQAVSVINGIDFGHLQIKLVDLDPNDGIKPFHDKSRLVTDGDSQGPGIEGPVRVEALSPFGTRYTTNSAGGLVGFGVDFGVFETVLSAKTAAIFSVPARVGVSLRPGEGGGSFVELLAGFDTFSRASLGSLGSGPLADTTRLLTLRIDNVLAQPSDITYGYRVDVFAGTNGVPAVPEPQTWALLALGLPLLAALARRRGTWRQAQRVPALPRA